MECRFCSYKWTPRVNNPKACPNCKTYFVYERKRRDISDTYIMDAINAIPKERRDITTISAVIKMSITYTRDRLKKMTASGLLVEIQTGTKRKVYVPIKDAVGYISRGRF